MRRLVVIFITIISLLGMTGITYAEAGISEIHFSAQVPEEFDRDINVLLQFEDTNTGLFTLKVSNGYELDSVIQTGNAVLKQIDIIGNIGQYEVNAPGEININENEQGNFNITVKDTELENMGEKIIDDTEVKTEINTNINKEDITNDDTEINIAEAVTSHENSTNDIKIRLIKSIFTTAILLIVVLVIYLFVKYKKEN